MNHNESLPLTPHYKEMCFDGTERAQNFYWRNQALCDAGMFVGVMSLVAVLVGALA